VKRREFITLLGGAAAWAQQPAMPVIGLLSPRSPDSDLDRAGIDRKYVYRMMKKHGIARKE
jgi:hypothetical protein